MLHFLEPSDHYSPSFCCHNTDPLMENSAEPEEPPKNAVYAFFQKVYRTCYNYTFAFIIVMALIHMQSLQSFLRYIHSWSVLYAFALLYPWLSTYVFWPMSPWLPMCIWVGAVIGFMYLVKGPGVTRFYANVKPTVAAVVLFELVFDMHGFFIDCYFGPRLLVVFGFLVIKTGSVTFYMTLFSFLFQFIIAYFFGGNLIAYWLIIIAQLLTIQSDVMAAHFMYPLRYMNPSDFKHFLTDSLSVSRFHEAYELLSSTSRQYLAREAFMEIKKIKQLLGGEHAGQSKASSSSSGYSQSHTTTDAQSDERQRRSSTGQTNSHEKEAYSSTAPGAFPDKQNRKSRTKKA